jgi:hypothetical protein
MADDHGDFQGYSTIEYMGASPETFDLVKWYKLN